LKRLPLSFFLVLLSLLASLCLPGCVTPKKKSSSIISEDDEARSRREVYGNWLRPSVSEEDKEFFYKPFWKLN
jgi:hypothetical protein